jgi:hypothetical protein
MFAITNKKKATWCITLGVRGLFAVEAFYAGLGYAQDQEVQASSLLASASAPAPASSSSPVSGPDLSKRVGSASDTPNSFVTTNIDAIKQANEGLAPSSGQIVLPDLGEPDAPRMQQDKRSSRVSMQAPAFNLANNQQNPGLPSDGFSRASGTALANNASQPLPNGSAPNAAAGMPQQITLGDANAGALLGPTGTSAQFSSKDYLANIGVTYANPQSSYGYGIKASGAALLKSNIGLGANLALNQYQSEFVLNGVWLPEDTNLKVKLSAGYMWGTPTFNFYSGSSSANVTQTSYYLSTQYIVPKEQSDYLHTVGVSAWGARANQKNNPDPVYSVVQTASAYEIMMDPKKLATGILKGAAVDAQVGLSKEVITKAAVGYESLQFPFSDGTREKDYRIYQDYVVQYQPLPELALQAGYKMGAALNNLSLSAAYGPWQLTGFRNIGNSGVTSSTGALLSYTISLDRDTKAIPPNILVRPQLLATGDYALRDAITRPIQLPQTFLAKVDLTAVKKIATIDKNNLPSGTTINAQGDLVLLVGSGGGSITNVTFNGAAYAYQNVMQIAGPSLIVRTRSLSPVGGTYLINVTDSTNTSYLIKITTAA